MNESTAKRAAMSLRAKFLLLLMPMMVLSLTTVAALGVRYIKASTETALRESMEQTVMIAADRVSDHLATKRSLAKALASRIGALYSEDITKPYESVDINSFVGVMSDMASSFGFLHMYVVDGEGFTRTATHSNIAAVGPEFYKAIALDGQDGFMSDVEQDNAAFAGEYLITIAEPIRKADGSAIGILVCKTNASQISEMVTDIMIGEGGSTFIMDANMQCIAHREPGMLYGGEQFKAVIEDGEYASLNGLWNNMHDNDSGFQPYDYDGPRLAAFNAIDGTNNWAIAVTASEKEYMQLATNSITRIILVAGLWVLICTFGILIFLNRVTGRIGRVTKRLELLAQGDLSTEIVVSGASDEVGRLANAAKKLQDELHQMIDGIENSLEKIAVGDLTDSASVRLPGDLAAIHTVIDVNRRKLSEMIRSISRTAEEVARGASQMASSASGLAQGAAEQSGSVEELFATVTDLTEKAAAIGGEAHEVSLDEDDGEKTAEERAEEKMAAAKSVSELLRLAMARIGEAATAIRKISSDIDAISSETGMLALNASVEATHAGEYGRGFAVIASEVRSLSEKSRDAARAANKKIDGIGRAVERGNQTVDHTISSVAEMTAAIGQIKRALEQISNVIENTAATAEETAASSEELSAQADMLREMVSGFKCES